MRNGQLQLLAMMCGALAMGPGAGAQTAANAAEGGRGGPVATGGTAPGSSLESASVSSVRIVRLSQVRGTVRMDRSTGRGFEAAFANIPVVGGARLLTGQGVAEVEFEDNSSLRLAPQSEVQFTELSRTATGKTVTAVAVLKGIAYVSLEKTKGNAFALIEDEATVLLTPGAHVRLDARQPELTLAVFEGEAALRLGTASTVVSRHETVELNPAARTVSTVSRGVEEQDFDAWDKQGQDYHRQKASLAGTGGFGLYGANDLNYYGAFADMPGCGSMWRPYFADAAWDPFASGVWAWYPAAGYSWVSPYPWGWLPYHSGSWVSCGAAGWGWRPGGSWYGVNNVTALRIANHPLPHPVPPGPVRNEPTLIPVNMRAVPVSGVESGDHFTFRQNSAGLGVPRAEYGNLHGMAAHVDRQGVVERGLPANSMVLSTSTRAGAEMGVGRSSGMGQASGRTGFASSSGTAHGGGVSASTSSSGGAGSTAGSAASVSAGGGGGGGGAHH